MFPDDDEAMNKVMESLNKMGSSGFRIAALQAAIRSLDDPRTLTHEVILNRARVFESYIKNG